jgi:transposase
MYCRGIHLQWVLAVDGLQTNSYLLRPVNTAAVTQYDGLKYNGDHHDAFHLAHLMQLAILPAGHIYSKTQRAI